MGFANSAAPERFFRADTKDQRDRTNLDLVPRLERGPTGNTVSVDRSATLTAKVLHKPGLSLRIESDNGAAILRDGLRYQIDLRGAANDDIFTAQQLRARREPGKNGDRRFQS